MSARRTTSPNAAFVADPGNRGLQARKALLREQLTRRRRTIPADLRDTTRWKVINHLRTLVSGVSPAIISLYLPREGVARLDAEIDLLPLAQELWQMGQSVCLPRRVYPGHPFTFNLWHPGDQLHSDVAGYPAAEGAEVVPSLMLIPVLGYNRRGYRLSSTPDSAVYGYDATIKSLRWPVTTVGVCYTELEIPDYPAEYADVRLDAIVTGREVIFC